MGNKINVWTESLTALLAMGTVKLCDKRRELKQKKNTAEGAKLYREANHQVKKAIRKAKETWTEEQCQGIKENLQQNNSKKAYQLVKEAGKCFSEEQDILKRWTEYSFDLYTHNKRSQGARCPPPTNNDSYPIYAGRSQSCSKITEERQVGRSGQHSIRAGPGRGRGHDRHVAHHLQYDLADRRVANTLNSVLDHQSYKERQPTTMPKLPHHQPDQSSKQGHAKNPSEQTEIKSWGDHQRRTDRLQSKREHNWANFQS